LTEPLPESFYQRDTVEVARDLLGRVLYRSSPQGLTAGIIVETEAYLRDDPACHASRGKTRRNAPMFGPPGRAYVYFIYGNHFCFNVVTAPEGVGEAVLVRALEPVAGLELMQKRRGGIDNPLSLTSGPGKLCQALAITADFNYHPLTEPPLWIGPGQGEAPGPIVTDRRIGISRAEDRLLRFYLADNPYVSRRAKVEPRNY